MHGEQLEFTITIVPSVTDHRLYVGRFFFSVFATLIAFCWKLTKVGNIAICQVHDMPKKTEGNDELAIRQTIKYNKLFKITYTSFNSEHRSTRTAKQ